MRMTLPRALPALLLAVIFLAAATVALAGREDGEATPEEAAIQSLVAKAASSQKRADQAMEVIDEFVADWLNAHFNSDGRILEQGFDRYFEDELEPWLDATGLGPDSERLKTLIRQCIDAEIDEIDHQASGSQSRTR